MKISKIDLVGLVIVVLLTAGCISPAQEWNFPFTIDPNQSLVYVGLDSIEVYLVGGKNVLYVRSLLPENRVAVWRVELGSDIAQFVLPMGPVVPFPKSSDYAKSEAKSSVIIYKDPPTQNDRQIGNKFKICLEDIQFADENLYNSGCLTVVIGVMPP